MLSLRRAGAFLFLLIFFLLKPVFIFSQESEIEDEQVYEPLSDQEMEELRRRIYGEASKEFINLSLGDSSVSLFLTGSWKGSLQGNFGFSKSPLGYAFASPDTPILFKQEADIMLSLWIRDKWFVEANFLDDSSQNTYRAGYEGFPGDFFQYAGIGNTGLDFPSFPYIDLGGDTRSSFGFFSHMNRGNLDIYALLRYDIASREERVFTGGRERTYSYVQVEDSRRGVSFVLPDTNIDTDIIIYIEDEKGTLFDTSGRRWRLALPGEYSAGKTQGLAELNVKQNGMVAAAYSANGNSQPWNASMGYYDGSAPGSFLDSVQNWFDSVNLENYPQCGNGIGASSRPGDVRINGVYALVIYEPGTFSPFERRSRYDSPNSSEYASLVKLSSGAEINGFALVLQEESLISDDAVFSAGSVNRKTVYELLHTQGGYSLRDPKNYLPLVKEYPEIYLPGLNVFTGDIVLRFTNFNETEGFYIGTDASANSIQVYRSGIQDTAFSYNQSSGEVSLSSPAGNNEIIRITFLRRSEETRLGSITAGAGLIYDKKDSPFSASGALGVRWNLTESSSFTEDGVSSLGTAGLSGKVSWDFDNLKAQVTAGFTFEQTDTTGLYRAAGMEGNEIIIPLTSDASFLSQPPAGFSAGSRADMVYRNYFNNSAFGSALMNIDWSGSSVVANWNKPYPAKDSLLGNANMLVMEFTLDDQKNWTGFEIPLNNDAGFLSRAIEIEIPYRFEDFTGDVSSFRLFIQIGSLSGKDFAFIENQQLVWEEEIFPAGSSFDTKPRKINFPLTDEERLKLGNAEYLRIIAVYEGTLDEVSGKVILAPPVVRSASFKPVTFDGADVSSVPDFINNVRAWEKIDSSLETAHKDIIKRLHPSNTAQRVLYIEWDVMQKDVSAGIDGRMGELPLSGYRQLSFFVKAPESFNDIESLRFIVASGPESIEDARLEAVIPLNASVFKAGQWSKVTIRYQGGNTGVTVDGKKVTGASFNYNQTQERSLDGKTDYLLILVEPREGEFLPAGNISIDEIIFEESLLVYRMNAGSALEYSRRGNILSAGKISVLSDFFVFTTLESEIRAGNSQDNVFRGSAVNRTGSEFSLFGAKTQINFSTVIAKNTFNWSESHSISKSIGLFSFKESFSASPQDGSGRRNLTLNFSSDFYARFDADAVYDYSRLRQKWNLNFGYRSQKDFIPSAVVRTEVSWTGKILKPENSFGKLWLLTWEKLLPDAGGEADTRRIFANITLTERTKPVGAVITLEGSANFSGINSITRLENSFIIDIPVIIGRTNLNFRISRNFKKQLFYSGSDITADINKFFESVNDSIIFWKAPPLYSLFTPELNRVMKESVENSPLSSITSSSSLNDQFGVSMNFGSVYSLASFLIPSRAAIRFDRVLENKLDSYTDTFSLNGNIGFSAINMFGLMGYKSLFKFYQSDEFSYNFDGTLIFNNGQYSSWRYRFAFGAGFRGFSGSLLNIVNTFNYRSGGFWSDNLNASWIAPTKRSILSRFYDWLTGKVVKQDSWINLSLLLNSDYEQLRIESLELAFDKTGDYFKWNMTAGHESIIRILGRMEFSVYANLRTTSDIQRETFIFDVRAGVNLRISF